MKERVKSSCEKVEKGSRAASCKASGRNEAIREEARSNSRKHDLNNEVIKGSKKQL